MIVLATAFACGGDDDATSAADAAPPDAARELAIGDICLLLTDVICTRDAECFDFFELPCDDSYYRWCCEDNESCEFINGVTQADVDACITALEQATCEEIDSDFPQACVGITSTGGPPG